MDQTLKGLLDNLKILRTNKNWNQIEIQINVIIDYLQEHTNLKSNEIALPTHRGIPLGEYLQFYNQWMIDNPKIMTKQGRLMCVLMSLLEHCEYI